MTILIIGKNGQIGWELERTLLTLGNVVGLERQDIDLAYPETIVRIVRDIKPAIIVNAAAYTAVDKAESEAELAMAINGRAPGILAEEAKRLGSILVHYSTDYVFNGQASKPYLETDKTDPLNVYGVSKLAGEKAIEAVGGKFLLLRTSWVYGSRGKNFLLTMLQLAHERTHLKIVKDQIGAPTWSRFLAQATGHILSKCLTDTHEHRWGTYHLTARGQTSWYGFAEAIFQLSNAFCPSPNILGIPSTEYPLPARRPLFSVLSNEKVAKTFNLTIPDWKTTLRLCLNEHRMSRMSSRQG